MILLDPHALKMTRIAFLGLGAIGTPMAAHLARVFPPLTVWNRTGARATEFAARHGARAAKTPADAARDTDIVVTCLPTSHEVEELLEGSNGLLSGMRSGSLLVDCTSGDPAVARRTAATLAGRGIDFVDAPVSGGTSGAAAGTLTVMCGGSPKAVATAEPVLCAFAGKIVHCGEVGAGHAVKAVNNALLAVHIWSTAEGLAALAATGVQPDVALSVINSSSGRSNSSENLFPSRVLTGAFPRTFRLALLDKDTGIAAQVARAAKVPSPLLQLTAEMFRLAHNELGEEADHVEAVRVVERMAGVEIRAAGGSA
jgi:3-hydroxyisobutyrate dehydrogenase